MVHTALPPNAAPLHLPAPTNLERANTEPSPLPSHRLRAADGHLLAVHPGAAERAGHQPGAGRAFLPAGGVWACHFGAG